MGEPKGLSSQRDNITSKALGREPFFKDFGK